MKFIIFVLMGLFVRGNTPVFASPGPAVCSATTVESLRTCFDKIRDGETSNLEIGNLITCQGPLACAFSLQGIKRPIYIWGKENAGAGLKRLDNFNYPLLTVDDSQDMRLVNLLFEEDASTYCEIDFDAQDQPRNACPTGLQSTISVKRSSNIIFDRLTINNSRRMAIEVRGTDNFVLRNSTIFNSMIFGIWLASRETHLENNIFRNIRSNAILFGGNAPADKPSTINGNRFIHNHRETVFHDSAGRGIGGGQMYLAPNTNNLEFKNNIIRDGSQDTDTWQFSGGIEYYFDKIHNVTIANNDIHHNTGPGIYMWGYAWGSVPLDINGIVIQRNRLYGNGMENIPLVNGVTALNNCFSADCSLVIPRGTIGASPNPCLVPAGQTTCSSLISWSTTNVSAAKVKRDGVQFASETAGSRVIADLTEAGSTFEIYASGTFLNSIFVRGIAESPSPSPTPTVPACLGDINADRAVNQADLTLLNNCYFPFNSPNAGCQVADLNNNGVVNALDYSLLLTHWGNCS